MKKKIAFCLILGCLTASALGGCGSRSAARAVNSNEETEVREEKKEDEEDEDDDFGYPVLGQEDIEDYEGFEYLHYELLTTESGDSVPVYVPSDEYAYAEENYIRGLDAGISYRVELEPYIRMDEEDYRINENLDYHLESLYDPEFNSDYLDVVISDVEKMDRDTAYATAEYGKYNEYDDSYYAVFATYLLKKLDNGVTVFVELEIDSDEVTKETAAIIDELEAFYQIEIDWNQKRADQKIEELIETGGGNMDSEGSFAFEIPEDWSQDMDKSDSDIYVYAPYGDVELSHCFLSIGREYMGLDASDLDALEDNQELLVAMVKQQMDEDDEYAGDVSFYGQTDLGVIVKAEMQAEDEDGVTMEAHMYWIFSEDYMYIVTAAQYGDDAWDDPFAVAEDIIVNGRRGE